MAIPRLRLGTLGTLRTQLVVALTLALAAVAVPYPDASVKANGATGLIISTTTVTANVNPSLAGQTVTFTATVAGEPITNYTDPTISGPAGITVGPDGALWFVNYDNNSIGRITTAGVVTNYPAVGTSGPLAIVAGPDGNLWFTSNLNDKIGKVSTAGAVTLYTDAAKITRPLGIAAGPDGALWFADGGVLNQRTIGQITTAGVVTAYSDGPVGCDAATKICEPAGITTGSDGALWYANSGSFPVLGGSIGRITTAGVRTNYTGTGVSTPLYITAGPDSALWFTNSGNSTIGRSDTAGAITNYASANISGPRVIAAGSDGNLWFANYVGDSIGRITTLGAVTKYPAAPAASVNGPYGIVSGPDGALWFTNYDGDSIGRISPAAPAGGTATGTVQFSVDGTNVGSPVALDGSGQAQLAVSTLTVGNHIITAVYGGDSAFNTSTSPDFTQTVNNKPATSTAVTSNNNPSVFAQPVTFTATVSEVVSGSPTGTVNFKDGGTTIAGCGAAALNASGQATCGPLTDLAVGNHTITAVYSGDSSFATSTSPSLTQTVNKAATSAAVTSNNNPSVFGQPVTFTATVSEAVSGSPTGTVNFNDGGTTIAGCGAAAMNPSGQATCGPLTDLTAGDHTISAVYSGDATFTTSTSPALTQTVTNSAAVDTTAPYTGYVEVELNVGGQVSSGPLLLSWSASDNVTPASDLVHQIQIRRLKNGAWTPWTNVATVTSNEFATVRPLWRHFQYRVQTRDQAGNWGAWEESDPIVLMRRDDRHFRKSSGWTTLPMAAAMRGDIAQSSIIGSWARLRFWGSGVALVMPAGAGLGTIEVCLDAGTTARQCQNVDLSTFTPNGQRRLVAVFNGFVYGLHHLRVRVTGGTVDLDGALISR